MAKRRKRKMARGGRAKVCPAPSGDRKVWVQKVRVRGRVRYSVRAKLGAGDGKPRARNGGCLTNKRFYGAFISKSKADASAKRRMSARRLA